MKVLREEIYFCGECPYCRYDREFTHFECIKDRNTVDNIIGNECIDVLRFEPPDWCPLPDKH